MIAVYLKKNSYKSSARNGNLEVPVYFLQAKEVHGVRKMEEDAGFHTYCQVPVWNTVIYRPISSTAQNP
jgi:hypothetical protein